MGKIAKELGKDDLTKLMKKLGTDPSLTDKVLASYKLFNADMLAGSKKIANAIGAENLGEVMLKYANDPAKVASAGSDAAKIFGVLGNTVNANVLETAFQAGKATADVGGPEALQTLALWDKSLLESNSAVILARRAGRDYKFLQDVDNLMAMRPIDFNKLDANPAAKALIEKIAVGALQIGEQDELILLGKWAKGMDGGFAGESRRLGATYFFPHTEFHHRLEIFFPGQNLRLFGLWTLRQYNTG